MVFQTSLHEKKRSAGGSDNGYSDAKLSEYVFAAF